MTSAKFLIYGLVDPRDGQLRYVGKSSSGLKRPRSEWRNALAGHEGRGRKVCWIKNLLKAGLELYGVVVIQEFDDDGILGQAERFWIAYFRQIGCRLTNDTDGGEGVSGYIPTADLRRARSEFFRSVTRTPEWKENISKSKLGKKRSAEEIAAVAAGIRSSAAFRAHLNKLHAIPPFWDQNGVRYESLKEAATKLGLWPQNISHVLKGRYRHTGGYVFSRIPSSPNLQTAEHTSCKVF
jgi:hypothetical protein